VPPGVCKVDVLPQTRLVQGYHPPSVANMGDENPAPGNHNIVSGRGNPDILVVVNNRCRHVDDIGEDLAKEIVREP
jgi:hypothetical protein